MGHLRNKDMTLKNSQVNQAGQVMFMTEDSLENLITKNYREVLN